ncbi:MAG: hypothetical protein A3A08_01375 [Candidatus Nealsonbacteria bacterium RIFCSPLOWO2_01_FULL_41_9]|uniref:HTH HARE-type domain-containing protein n=1 Tax=Candidatus Nealsonbacteria bacterium RIFCSPLOWO2_01_FULL_41_9 TaxID=1801671 RepID=A0A1G2EE01_9BACT|nr:MAG: hypothetical protein A3A08_01375 [Candidatus Nealsonbacteria bacterium RIFCSPLOWO2_01_FULL_41_9]
MNSFKDIAYQILKEAGKSLHSKEITKAALERGFKTKGKTPWKTMDAELVVDINSKGELSRFKKAGPSIFTLNDKKVEIEEESKPDRIIEELELEEQKEIEGGYIGKAGEHAVLSELLFRGYNAALMSVDVGIDIVATKDNETFNIQIKTRNISRKHEAFYFNLRIASFERHNAGRTFYIFILRENSKLDYLILPLHQIEKSIEEEFIHIVGKGKLYRITIKKRGGKVYLGRQENVVSYYMNRWDVIK